MIINYQEKRNFIKEHSKHLSMIQLRSCEFLGAKHKYYHFPKVKIMSFNLI
jgi:hypothetical protein